MARPIVRSAKNNETVENIFVPSSLLKMSCTSCLYRYACRDGVLSLLSALYGNMTSSSKPEVHNILQRRQRRTEPRPQATRTKIWWSWAVWFSSYASIWADKQTYSSQYFTTVPGLSHKSHVKKMSFARESQQVDDLWGVDWTSRCKVSTLIQYVSDPNPTDSTPKSNPNQTV